MTGFLSLEVRVSDFQKAQRAIMMANDGETYRGMFKETIEYALSMSLWYMKNIVHFDTRRLWGALDWKYDSHRMSGEVYISDRTAWNSSANVRREPQKYGIFEEHRGGPHAFMHRTLKEKTEVIAPAGLSRKVKEIRWP